MTTNDDLPWDDDDDDDTPECLDCGMPCEPNEDSLAAPGGGWLHLKGCKLPAEAPVGDQWDAMEDRHAAASAPSVVVSCDDCESGCAKCDPDKADELPPLQCEVDGCRWTFFGERTPPRCNEHKVKAEEPATRGPVQPCPKCGKLTGRRPLCPPCNASGSGAGAGDDHGGGSGDGPSEEEERLEPVANTNGVLHMVRMFDKATVCGRTGKPVNLVEQVTDGVTCKSCLRMASSELELRERVKSYGGKPKEAALEDAPPVDAGDYGRLRLICPLCGTSIVTGEDHWPRAIVHPLDCDCGAAFTAFPAKLGDTPPSKTADHLDNRPPEGKWPCGACGCLAHHHLTYSEGGPLACVSCDCPAFMEPSGADKGCICSLCLHTYSWSLGPGVANLCDSCCMINCLVPYDGPAQIERLQSELAAKSKLAKQEADLSEPDLPPCEADACGDAAAVKFNRKGKGYPVLLACRKHADDPKVRGRRRAFSEL